MTTPIEVVKQYNKAFEAKDTAKLRKLTHKNYRFQGPLMQINGVEEMVEMAESCPFSCSMKNVRFIAEGNKVAQMFDWDVSSPFKGVIPMCEFLEVEGDVVKSSHLFFDTNAFPKDVLEQMQQMAQGRKAA